MDWTDLVWIEQDNGLSAGWRATETGEWELGALVVLNPDTRRIRSVTLRNLVEPPREMSAEMRALAEELVRRPGEPPVVFYARVGAVHSKLSGMTSRPTAMVSELAGVSRATAAIWVHRAREYDVYPTGGA